MGEFLNLALGMLAAMAIMSGLVVFMGGGAVAYAPTTANFTSTSSTFGKIQNLSMSTEATLENTKQGQSISLDTLVFGALNSLMVLLAMPSLFAALIGELTVTPLGDISWLTPYLLLAISLITVFTFLKMVLKVDA